MSMTPNDPFESNQNDQGFGQSPPPKKSGKGCLIGCGLFSVLAMLVCCGGGFFFFQFALSILGSEYERQLTGNPLIVEHVGEIESFEASLSATFEEAQKAEAGGDTPLAFEVKGSKGSATVLVVQDDSGDATVIKSAVLVLPDGTRLPLEVTPEPTGLEEFDVEGLEMDLDELIDAGEVGTEVREFQSDTIETEPSAITTEPTDGTESNP